MSASWPGAARIAVCSSFPAPRSFHRLSRRRLWQAGVGLGAASVTGGPHTRQGEAAGDPTTFVIAATRPPTDLDPHSAYDAGSGLVLAGPFEPLIRLAADGSGGYDGVIAESWEANADQSVWTFRIRDGITFQDGSLCDAEAVRASFERLLTMRLAASNVLSRFLTTPEQITAPDARTVVFHLGRPQPLFVAALAAPYGSAIVNASLARQHEESGDWGHAWARNRGEGLGTGPYRIARFETAERVELARFDGYWRGWTGAQFSNVLIRFVPVAETRRELVERGDADLVDTIPVEAEAALEGNPDVVVTRRYSLRVTYLIMTVAEPLVDPVVRQALCWAFPYDDVIDGVYDGHAKRAIGPLSELCRGFDSTTFVYQANLARARTMLVEAGVPDGTSLRMMAPNANPAMTSIAQLFAANLGQIGLEVEIETAALDLFAAMLYGDMPAEERPHLFPWFWTPDYDDGWRYLWPQISCDAWTEGNAGHYCNSRIEELLVQTRDAADPATYQSALLEIQQIATRDDPAAIYFAQLPWTTVERADVGGYAPHAILPDIIDYYQLYRAS